MDCTTLPVQGKAIQRQFKDTDKSNDEGKGEDIDDEICIDKRKK
jgi:hypothetical protein